MRDEIIRLAEQIIMNGEIADEYREAFYASVEARSQTSERFRKIAEEAEGKYNLAIAGLAAKIGAPVELDGPPAEPGQYWLFTPAFPEEGDPEKLESVKVFRASDSSLVFDDNHKRLHRVGMYSKKEGCRWWTCPKPKGFPDKETICEACLKNVIDVDGCICRLFYGLGKDGSDLPPIPVRGQPLLGDEIARCPVCFAKVGNFHHHGCRMEICPACSEKVVHCFCWEDKMLEKL